MLGFKKWYCVLLLQAGKFKGKITFFNMKMTQNGKKINNDVLPWATSKIWINNDHSCYRLPKYFHHAGYEQNLFHLGQLYKYLPEITLKLLASTLFDVLQNHVFSRDIIFIPFWICLDSLISHWYCGSFRNQ